MENRSILNKSVRIIFLGFVVFFLVIIVLAWFGKEDSKQWCNEFASKVSLNSALMDQTFKILLSIEGIENFYVRDARHIIVFYKNIKDNNLVSILDKLNKEVLIFGSDYGNYLLSYQHSPKYKKEVQKGIVRLKMIDSIYIGNTRSGIRFTLKRTEQGDIDTNSYNLEVECDARGDRLRRIRIK